MPKQAAMTPTTPKKNNSSILFCSFLFMVVNISPDKKQNTTIKPPKPKTNQGLISSYCIMPTSITPPKTILAMSIKKFPVSSRMFSFVLVSLLSLCCRKDNKNIILARIFFVYYSRAALKALEYLWQTKNGCKPCSNFD